MRFWLTFRKPGPNTQALLARMGVGFSSLTWVVDENWLRPASLFKESARVGFATIGRLSFSTGPNEGWWFIPSGDSSNLFLGPRVREAMKELRRRYRAQRQPKRTRKISIE